MEPTCQIGKGIRLCPIPRPFDGKPFLTIPLETIKDISNSSQVRGPTVSSRFALGALATDRTEEFIEFVYETTANAEAPIFRTQKAQAAAIEAKVRFRLRKLGIELPSTTAPIQ